jgi:hypothetical protein
MRACQYYLHSIPLGCCCLNGSLLRVGDGGDAARPGEPRQENAIEGLAGLVCDILKKGLFVQHEPVFEARFLAVI